MIVIEVGIRRYKHFEMVNMMLYYYSIRTGIESESSFYLLNHWLIQSVLQPFTVYSYMVYRFVSRFPCHNILKQGVPMQWVQATQILSTQIVITRTLYCVKNDTFSKLLEIFHWDHAIFKMFSSNFLLKLCIFWLTSVIFYKNE